MLLVRILPGWLIAKHGFVHFGNIGTPTAQPWQNGRPPDSPIYLEDFLCRGAAASPHLRTFYVESCSEPALKTFYVEGSSEPARRVSAGLSWEARDCLTL
jgi:hypothetical protein